MVSGHRPGIIQHENIEAAISAGRGAGISKASCGCSRCAHVSKVSATDLPFFKSIGRMSCSVTGSNRRVGIFAVTCIVRTTGGSRLRLACENKRFTNRHQNKHKQLTSNEPIEVTLFRITPAELERRTKTNTRQPPVLDRQCRRTIGPDRDRQRSSFNDFDDAAVGGTMIDLFEKFSFP